MAIYVLHFNQRSTYRRIHGISQCFYASVIMIDVIKETLDIKLQSYSQLRRLTIAIASWAEDDSHKSLDEIEDQSVAPIDSRLCYSIRYCRNTQHTPDFFGIGTPLIGGGK